MKELEVQEAIGKFFLNYKMKNLIQNLYNCSFIFVFTKTRKKRLKFPNFVPNLPKYKLNPMQSTYSRGTTYFELSNHLGNVLAVVTDRKLAQPDGGGGISYYLPDMVSATDYYPFGYAMEGRGFSSGNYRYGFNGMEKDNELKGSGNSYDFGARLLDVRLGRWLAVDPLAGKYPEYSDFIYTGNSPILFIDKNGKVIGNPNHPDAIKLKTALIKTTKGQTLWNQMENSKRAMNIMIAHEGDGADEATKNINKYLTEIGAAGMVLTKRMFEEISKTGTISKETMESAYEFDQETGELSKTAEWDETYVIMKKDAITLMTAIGEATGEDPVAAEDLAVIRYGGEEAAHSVQDYVDFYEKVKDPKTGKYIEQENKTPIPHDKRRHEIEAKSTVSEIEKEYNEKKGSN